MRICVYGAGAIGGHLAAKLSSAGHDVCAIARGRNLEALRARGIALRHGERTFSGRVRASDRAADLGPQDAVFVTTKATGLAALAEAAGPLSGPGTVFVFVQNGIPWWYAQGLDSGRNGARPRPPAELARLDPEGRLAAAIAPERVIGAVVYSSNDVVEPGVVENHTPDRNMLVLGRPDDAPGQRVEALRALLAQASIHSPPSADIRQVVWHKLCVNFGSALCVPLGEPISAVLDDPALKALRERLIAEGRSIARAHGVDPEGAPKRPGGQQPSAHKPSMLQDYELGRPMEVDALLAVPLAFARAAGADAPALESLTALVARLAARKGLYS
jgi:2-dehydropantoate 2-reductase